MTLKQALQRQRFKTACTKCSGSKMVSMLARGGKSLYNGTKTMAGFTPAGLAMNAAFDAPGTLFYDAREGGRGWNLDQSQNLKDQRDAAFAARESYKAHGPSTPFVNAARYDLTLPLRFTVNPLSTANMVVGGISDAAGNIAKSIGGMGLGNTIRSFAGLSIPGAKPKPVNTNALLQSRSNPVPLTASSPITTTAAAAPIYKPTSVKQAVMTKTVPLHVLSVDGTPKGDLDVEVADNDESKRKGLSKRASLPNDRGMLFDCPGPFWMKDVNFSLDIMFLNKRGEILDQQRMAPNPALQEWQMPRYRCKSAEAALALEAPAGWCRKHNVITGDKVRLDN